MANVKPIVLNSSGVLEELSSSNTLIIPTLASHPGTNAPSGFVYIYSLTSDNSVYQKDSAGTVTKLTNDSSGGLSEDDVIGLILCLG
jgi:hypothetical protein